MEQFIPDLAGLLGVDPATLLLIWLVLYVASNTISRLIPENASGWQANVRKVAAVIGVHVKNRVYNKVTPESVTQILIAEAAKQAPIKPPAMPPVEIPIPPEFAAYLQTQLPPENETDHER